MSKKKQNYKTFEEYLNSIGFDYDFEHNEEILEEANNYAKLKEVHLPDFIPVSEPTDIEIAMTISMSYIKRYGKDTSKHTYYALGFNDAVEYLKARK